VPEGLLAPRLYRAAFAPALLALVVLAFSLQDPARGVSPELSPPGFSAMRASQFADQAVINYGARRSGSADDNRLAQLVAARMEGVGFDASVTRFDATTLSGRRPLTQVVGIRPGPSDRRLLVVASRDGAPGELRRSGALETGILLEMARVLQGRNFDHTIVLASVSGGVDGGLGAKRLAETLRGPFDGVLILRNVGGPVDDALTLTTNNSRRIPGERYSRTVRHIAGIEFSRPWVGQTGSLTSQLMRLGFPLSLGEQAAFIDNGLTAVSVSPAGEALRPVVGNGRAAAMSTGQTALRTLTTMDDAFIVAPPSSAPLRVGGKLIPQWALLALIGALFFPLLVASIDAWARARRWNHVEQRGLLAPAIALVWLLVIGFLLRGAGLSGLIHAPPLPPDPAGVSGFAATAIGLLAGVFAVFGVLVAAGAARQATPKGGEAAFALWVVFTGLLVFVVNPVAAGFLIVLLHLTVLMLLTAGRPRRRQIALLALVGLLPLIFALAWYPALFSISPGGLIRYAVLIEAGGFVSPAALAAGCAVVAAVGTALIQLWWSAPRAGEGPPRRRLTQSF
jgi:hypothetical protein